MQRIQPNPSTLALLGELSTPHPTVEEEDDEQAA
jgi:hypothetical protein